MQEIQGNARKIRELLKGVKYSIDYYQREYKWQTAQIRELIQDLTGKFLEDYESGHARHAVADYGHYFLGSIIISRKQNASFIVDGQQRVTSLTLLLMYLRNRQKGREEQVNVDELIYSEKFGKKSFNLHVDERAAAMQALFEEQHIDPNGQPESVQNILERYEDIKQEFPEDLTKDALPYFIDWLIENVHLIEITAYSDEDAYTIFETMNDRGLSLNPTDMLKGYLLANITDSQQRTSANDLWKKRIQDLTSVGKEVESDFFKAWFRSQYAETIRVRKLKAQAEDFERIGTEYHRWVKDNEKRIGLDASDDFFRFIDRDFRFFSGWYLRLMQASRSSVQGLEHVLYNAHHGFTLQYMVLLAPLRSTDSEEIALLKVRLVAMYLDILLTRRLWNFRSITYSTMYYGMFGLMLEIRGLEPQALAQRLYEKLARDHENFSTNERFALHQQNRKYIHRILARLTDYVERRSGSLSHYHEYVADSGRNHYEVEHIWANKYERHRDEFAHQYEFIEYRNRIGGLLLLPRSFNASYGALPYEDKLVHYNAQNLLARSLGPLAYDHNPGFQQYITKSELPFQPHEQFKKVDLDARSDLYRKLAKRIWNPKRLLREAEL